MYLNRNMYRGNFGNNPATMRTGSALIGYAVTNAEAYVTAYSSQRRHEYTHTDAHMAVLRLRHDAHGLSTWG